MEIEAEAANFALLAVGGACLLFWGLRTYLRKRNNINMHTPPYDGQAEQSSTIRTVDTNPKTPGIPRNGG